jgi:membrane protease YdiL (CAAX protease family)
MRLSIKEWIVFIMAACVSLLLWFKFSYPQLSFVDLSVEKAKASEIAQGYLTEHDVPLQGYSKAIVFDSEEWADRYLQKTIGFKAQEEFIRQQGFELFSWKVRFYKQFQKEEYIVKVSPKTGRILSFEHLIEDVEPRITPDKDIAKRKAADFLERAFGIDLKEYDFHEEEVKRFDKRIDYSFSWEKKGVYVPYNNNEGGAKLLAGATVSGEEIKKFYINKLDVPEKFKRYIARQAALGEYLYSFHFIIFLLFVTASIYMLLKRKSDVIMSFCRKWFLSLSAFLIIINLLFVLNNIQGFLINYPTSSSLVSFAGVYLVRITINIILICVAFILVGAAGESLRKEIFPEKRYASFMHYLKASFFTRPASQAVVFGYIIFFISLGLQALIYWFGQRYLGVWKEWERLTEFSSSYIPALSAFSVGITASLNEEVFFRLFGISWAKKYLKNTIAAVVLASLIWGFGHTQYPIFPVWFRGIEVTIIGLLFGFIFIKYGLIPLIVAHYLFDAFWGVSAYILGKSHIFLFTSSVFVLTLPLVWAGIAFLMNRKEEEKEIKIALSETQKYNLEMLKVFILSQKSKGVSASDIAKELIAHNWDSILVELAVKEAFEK